jgi:glycosyltransferase involved in cell wall biosynthesis
VSDPLVSVVMATYNASHLLRYSLASVLRSDLADLEVLVVGDHCTDDTPAVVAGFADPRVRFLDLERNSGQQATPNNVGIAAARGEYLAFLNQDDLYLPDHLGRSLARIRKSGADILCWSHPVIPSEQRERIAKGEIVARLDGVEPDGRYSPQTFHVASAWFLRRRAALEVGPWKLERSLWVSPSQEWLFRAWRRGRRIEYAHEGSLVAIYSGARRDFHRRRDAAEHAFVFENVVATDRLRPQMFASAREWHSERRRRAARERPWPKRLERRARGLRDQAIQRLLMGLGLHPNTWMLIRRTGWRRGSYIRMLKARTG